MLEFEEYKTKLNALKPDLEVLRSALKLESAQKEIEELEAASAREGFWNDVEKSQKVQKRLKNLKDKVENFRRLHAGGAEKRLQRLQPEDGVYTPVHPADRGV